MKKQKEQNTIKVYMTKTLKNQKLIKIFKVWTTFKIRRKRGILLIKNRKKDKKAIRERINRTFNSKVIKWVQLMMIIIMLN